MEAGGAGFPALLARASEPATQPAPDRAKTGPRVRAMDTHGTHEHIEQVK